MNAPLTSIYAVPFAVATVVVSATLLFAEWHLVSGSVQAGAAVGTLLAALLVASVEELVERKLALRLLAKWIPGMAANVLVSIGVSLAHRPDSLAEFASHWAFSMWMGCLYLRAADVRPCVLAHAVVDWVWFLLVGVMSSTGNRTPALIQIDGIGWTHEVVTCIYLLAMYAVWRLLGSHVARDASRLDGSVAE